MERSLRKCWQNNKWCIYPQIWKDRVHCLCKLSFWRNALIEIKTSVSSSKPQVAVICNNILNLLLCLLHLSPRRSSLLNLFRGFYPAFPFPIRSPSHFPTSAPFPLLSLFPSLILFLSKPFQFPWDCVKLAPGCWES